MTPCSMTRASTRANLVDMRIDQSKYQSKPSRWKVTNATHYSICCQATYTVMLSENNTHKPPTPRRIVYIGKFHFIILFSTFHFSEYMLKRMYMLHSATYDTFFNNYLFNKFFPYNFFVINFFSKNCFMVINFFVNFFSNFFYI